MNIPQQFVCQVVLRTREIIFRALIFSWWTPKIKGLRADRRQSSHL